MTIEKARKEIFASINCIYEKDEANNIAELALEHVTRLSRIEILLNKSIALSKDQNELLAKITTRLQHHEPIQYILNEAWFGGMKFYVDKNVLIPRPETEELVEWILKEVKSQKSKVKILDVGTGSGCIAITLKNKLPSAEVWACDKSDEALTVARMNADSLKATVDFISLNFLDVTQRRQLPQFDIVVSNPPYVPQNEKLEMKKNVTEFEPAIALFVPDNDPSVFYRAIADFGKERLNVDGKIYVEIHEDLGEKVKQSFQTKGYKSAELKKDMQGKDRMIKVNL
ncbi:MAG TPA: peptide chain release factor N(5)-glutamine methyltransferase [Chitinophagaceae bacterium]